MTEFISEIKSGTYKLQVFVKRLFFLNQFVILFSVRVRKVLENRGMADEERVSSSIYSIFLNEFE